MRVWLSAQWARFWCFAAHRWRHWSSVNCTCGEQHLQPCCYDRPNR